MKPKVSIITVNFNGKRFLNSFFNSVKNIDYPDFEVIFVDNDSVDGSVDYVKRNYPEIKIIENRDNLGFAIANNNAVEIAQGEYLFFLNNDTKVRPNIITKLIGKMQGDKNIGICGCKMMSYDGERDFHSGIGIDIFGYPVACDRTFYIEGSALMIRKDLFKRLGGFDPKYFMFHEDVDLAWRVWLLGYQVSAISEAVIYHSVGASAGGAALIKEGQYKSTYFRRYFSERNNIRTLLKNYTINYLILIIPIYLLINVAEMLLFLLFLKPNVLLCYVKAYIWNLVNFRDTLFYRKKIQHSRKISDKEIVNRMYKGLGKFSAFNKTGIPKFSSEAQR